MNRAVLLRAAALTLSACATPPASLSGAFADITVAQAQRQDLVGQRVRWGGEIVSTKPEKSRTCFEVVSRPLDRAARPRRTDQSDGRFVACAAGFYDPAVYAPHRELTVVGTLEASTSGKIGEYEYRCPQVQAEHVYLWSRRHVEGGDYYDPWLYDPWFYNPWVAGPYWSSFWGPPRFCPGPGCW
jgi:outer membrane lipoprotein